MFLQDFEQLSIDKFLQCVPRFEEKKLVYYRREDTENFSFYIANGKSQELSMNGEAWEILKLCNGKRTIEEISNVFASRYDYIDSTIDFKKDVMKVLYMFNKLDALSWKKGGSPFMVQETCHGQNGMSVKWANESYIREISEAYRIAFGSKQHIKFAFPPDYIHKMLGDNLDQETLLRSKLFNYSEDYFVVYRNEKPEGVISIKNNLPDSNVVEIVTLLVPLDLVKSSLECIQQLLIQHYPFPISKIRIRSITPTEDSFSVIIPILTDFGFRKMVTLNNEYGKDKDLIIYDKMFNLKQ